MNPSDDRADALDTNTLMSNVIRDLRSCGEKAIHENLTLFVLSRTIEDLCNSGTDIPTPVLNGLFESLDRQRSNTLGSLEHLERARKQAEPYINQARIQSDIYARGVSELLTKRMGENQQKQQADSNPTPNPERNTHVEIIRNYFGWLFAIDHTRTVDHGPDTILAISQRLSHQEALDILSLGFLPMESRYKASGLPMSEVRNSYHNFKKVSKEELEKGISDGKIY